MQATSAASTSYCSTSTRAGAFLRRSPRTADAAPVRARPPLCRLRSAKLHLNRSAVTAAATRSSSQGTDTSSTSNTLRQLFAATDLRGEAQASLPVLLTLGACLLLSHADPASAADLQSATDGIPQHHLVAADLNSLAAVDEFLENVTRYGRYFVSVMAGTAYIMVKPFAGLFKRPVTAVLAVAGAVGLLYFINFTVSAMLGLTDPVHYEASSLVIR